MEYSIVFLKIFQLYSSYVHCQVMHATGSNIMSILVVLPRQAFSGFPDTSSSSWVLFNWNYCFLVVAYLNILMERSLLARSSHLFPGNVNGRSGLPVEYSWTYYLSVGVPNLMILLKGTGCHWYWLHQTSDMVYRSCKRHSIGVDVGFLLNVDISRSPSGGLQWLCWKTLIFWNIVICSVVYFSLNKWTLVW